MKALLAAAAVMTALASAVPADAATLIGKTFTADYFVPTTADPYASGSYAPSPFTVVAGVDAVGNIENVTFLHTDFGASNLRIDFVTLLGNPDPTLNSATFSGPIFQSSGNLGIAGASIGAATNLAGFTADRIFLTDDRIGLNFQGLTYHTGSVVALDFTFAPVPEAGAWVMMILGFGFAGFTIRSARRRALRIG